MNTQDLNTNPTPNPFAVLLVVVLVVSTPCLAAGVLIGAIIY